MKVIGGLDSVPTDILVVEAPRIQEEGSRWIPATFLDRGTNAAAHAGRPASLSPHGLLVSLFGIFLHEQPAFDIRQEFAGGSGDRRILRKDRKQQIYIGVDKTTYKVEGVNLEPDNVISWNEYCNTRLAIISILCVQKIQIKKPVNFTLFSVSLIVTNRLTPLSQRCWESRMSLSVSATLKE